MNKPPQFSTRDASRPEFWDERFTSQFIPWDKGGIPEAFRRYAESAPPSSCLIPGCGNGYEAALLANLHWDVCAIDFSPAAVSNAQRLFPDLAAQIVLADFFSYQPPKPIQIIYERAFFCALPPTYRERIVARWVDLLPPGGVLIGYFHIAVPSGIGGPPFSITRSELNAFLSPHFACIEDNPVIDSIPVFKDRERWMVWQKLA